MPGREVVLIFRSLHFAEILMDELHRHRSLTDSGSDALDGAVAYIANGKDTGHVGFEQERISVKPPSLRPLPVANKIGTGQKETALVPFDEVSQPICLWQ